MPPVSYRCAALCLLAPLVFACKPRSENSSAVKAAAATGAGGRISLDYDVAFRTLSALAGRLGNQGCQEAAHWLVEPKDKDLGAAIKAINESDRVYETAVANLLDVHWSYKTCQSEGGPNSRTDGIGMKILNEGVNAKGFGLTVVVVDGIGSMFTPDGPIAEARAEWAKAAKDFKGEPFLVEHIALGDLANLETAAQKLKTDWEAVIAKGGEKRRYLIWAHDVSGNMALDLLAESKSLRDKTIALVTLGTPLGGVVKTVFADRVKDQLSNVAGTVTQVVPAGVSSSMTKFSAAMAGLASLSPEARRSHLASTIKGGDFSRENDGFGKKTQVFHVASVIDPANLSPLPLASVKGGELAALMSTRSMEQALLVPFLASLKDEPLGDGLVSLPNAVIPKEYVPPSMDTTLIALTTFDHFGLQLTKRADDIEALSPPYAKIVDAIIEGIAPTFGGFIESKAEAEEPATDEWSGSAGTGGETKTCRTAKKPAYMGDEWYCRAPCEWVCSTCEAEGPDPVEACK